MHLGRTVQRKVSLTSHSPYSLTIIYIGVLQQIGDAGTAISAFLVVLLVVAQYHHLEWITHNPRTVSYSLLSFIVLFLILLILPPATSIKNYYGNTGLWCWIAHRNPETDRLQIGSAYALEWLATITSILGYGHVLVGTLHGADGGHQQDGRPQAQPDNLDVFTVEEAKGMMWYSLGKSILPIWN